MTDTLFFSMEVPSSSRGSTMKQLRKPRRTASSVETPGPELGDVFLGVTEIGSLDDVIASQRSESDERRSSGQSHRSRGSKSTGGGSKKPQASISKKDAPAGRQSLAGEELSLRESTTLARQQLTSSASRVRPSKQQQQQQQQPPQQQQSTRSLRPTTRQVTQAHTLHRDSSSISGRSLAQANNNNEDDDEPIVEEEGSMAVRRAHRVGAASHHQRGASEWEILYGVNQVGQLPSRIHRYLNVSAGSDGLGDAFPLPQQEEEDSPLSDVHDDRPPSRQRHAFPTHLLDARDFFSPAKHHEGTTVISITPWHADEDDESESVVSTSPEEDTSQTKQPKSDVRQRPPSRYMTKAPRGDSSSSSASSTASDEPQSSSSSGGRLPSRRGVAGQWNQAAQYHHDPKTDGFADLDERVPPPFRVEITTDSSRSQYVPSDHRRADEERRHSLRSRRASSFGTRAQLNKLQQAQAIYGIIDQEAGLRDRASSKRASSTRQSKVPCEPEWLGQDQEANPVTGLTVDVGHPHVVHHNNANIRELGTSRVDNNSLSTATTTNSFSNNTSSAAHQWFRASNNPFFLTPAAPPVVGEFDEMDADTAIANTPLFADEGDLMAMTQLSDLHLDDFMGDPYVSAAPPAPRTGTTDTGTTKAATGAEPGSKKLNTSLGKDFLSLFAQH